MPLLLFHPENLSPVVAAGSVHGTCGSGTRRPGPACGRGSLWEFGAALRSVGGDSGAGKGAGTGGFAEFKERL